MQKHDSKMVRKTIHMPANLIAKVDRIAREKNLSFSEAVRQAIDAYIEHEELLEAMVEMIIKLNQESIDKVDALMKRMDETHAMLKERPRA